MDNEKHGRVGSFDGELFKVKTLCHKLGDLFLTYYHL